MQSWTSLDTDVTKANNEKLLVRIPVAAEMLDISRSKAYAMAVSGDLPGVVRVGGSMRVSLSALRKWVNQKADTPTK